MFVVHQHGPHSSRQSALLEQLSEKEKYTDEKYNSAVNGLDLCPTCHKAFDRNGGNFSPDNEGKAFHSIGMVRIIQSKININDYAKIKKCL